MISGRHSYTLYQGLWVKNCHPRDNIAMSWLARHLNIKYDFFEAIMLSREKQAEWFADMMIEASNDTMELMILGRSFKPETDITTGSHAVLVGNILQERGHKVVMWDPWIDKEPIRLNNRPVVALIGTKHESFKHFVFPEGSVVLDPHRYIPEQKGVNVVHIGKSKTSHSKCR
jgi:UDPglucose 6-dehydrogenase